MAAKKYRKIPLEISAIQWTGSNHREMFEFLSDSESSTQELLQATGRNFYISHSMGDGGLVIKTLEGEHFATIGDFVIKGIKGEFYPCKLDIFNKSYSVI